MNRRESVKLMLAGTLGFSFTMQSMPKSENIITSDIDFQNSIMMLTTPNGHQNIFYHDSLMNGKDYAISKKIFETKNFKDFQNMKIEDDFCKFGWTIYHDENIIKLYTKGKDTNWIIDGMTHSQITNNIFVFNLIFKNQVVSANLIKYNVFNIQPISNRINFYPVTSYEFSIIENK